MHLELCAVLGKSADDAIEQVRSSLDEVMQLFKVRNNQQLEIEMAKGNYTKKVIPSGTKTPKNNQGVKPSPAAGSTIKGKK